VLAATYLDPEYQVVFTKEQRNWAKIELQAFCHWNTTRSVCATEKCLVAYCGKDHEFTPMQLMLMSKEKETNLSQVACSSFITSLINFFDLKNYTKVDCAFHYRAEQNSKMLSQLAWIVFAVTVTQVPVQSVA